MTGWVKGEKCRRKGDGLTNYFVADTAEAGVLLKVYRRGAPVGPGKWHSWKNMHYDFTVSSSELPGKPPTFDR